MLRLIRMDFWDYLSAFGDPFLTLPLAGVIVVWLAVTGRRRIALAWAAFFCTAMLLVGVTKFAYAGWGIEIGAVHFTVISGHTMLSSAVYPIACYLCAHGAGKRITQWSVFGGVVFAILIGISRVMVGAHSQSEVIVGWILGFVISGLLLKKLEHTVRPLSSPVWFFSACMVTAVACYGHAAPIQAWILDTAPQLAHHE